MQKKYCLLIIIIILVLSFLSCSQSGNNDNSDNSDNYVSYLYDDNISDITINKKVQIHELLNNTFGKTDIEYGFIYSFTLRGTIIIDNIKYYHITWSWIVDESDANVTKICDLILSLDFQYLYEGQVFYQTDKYQFDLTKNLLS